MGLNSTGNGMAAAPTQILVTGNPASFLPQIVPTRVCLHCDVCCRFPDPDSSLRPYFTEPEIERAVAAGIGAQRFPSRLGSQISLIPDDSGEGFQCPAFDATTGCCRIYEQRPLDCRLYPLALMWNAKHNEVVLGWDSKCPFMKEEIPDSIRGHADRITELLRRPDLLKMIVDHPRLIGNFQGDVVELTPLPELTRALSERIGREPLHHLRLEDLPRLSAALSRSGLIGHRSLAAYSTVYHYMSNMLLTYWWMELHGAFFLYVESPAGWFMPLPPLTNGPIEDSVATAFEFLRRRNGASPVSRIENVSAAVAERLKGFGYGLSFKEPEYMYCGDALAALTGDRYKSQRALCNRIERLNGVVIRSYGLQDRAECRRLLCAWRDQKQQHGLDPFGRLLLDDAASVHEVIWAHAAELGLSGTVVTIEGRICGYTFGYWLTPTTWCVLLEVADRSISGLAQYLFRETCRTAVSKGADYINTMDDAGLPGLRSSKEAYHPVLRIPSYIVSESSCA
ncbi:MAG TPA: phosphatidylglycerol lysyltransferase domain-containing protein [Nitrospira sp.]